MIKKHLDTLQFSELIQPHPRACTPANMAYLISLTSDYQFRDVLDLLLRDAYISNKLNVENKGIDFPSVVEAVNNRTELSVRAYLIDWRLKPNADPPFIIGVRQIPSVGNLEQAQLKSIELGKQVGSLVEQDGIWKYIYGHAITVVKIEPDNDVVVYFDSVLGIEMITRYKSFVEGLGKNGQLIKLR